jgi:2-methylisocitrate lyase-like PEP mutase family enzyme
MKFKKLHHQRHPLLLCNVWDVPSARVAENLNFNAIGTSSSAIASLLGYNDGEELEFSELEYMVKRIVSNTKLPVSVDLESGYSRKPSEIADYIKRLAQLGVAGINIEDSIVLNERTLLDAHEFTQTLAEVKERLLNQDIDIFINVRTDTFLLGVENTISETKKRIKLYENAGADGIFTPCIVNKHDIEEIADDTHLPINVMCMPNLPDFATLHNLGVKRISMGNFLFDKMYGNLEKITQNILMDNSFKTIF